MHDALAQSPALKVEFHVTKPTLTLDPEDVMMAMSDQMTAWQIDPITGKLCLDREEATIAFGSEEAELWAPTDPQRVLESPHFRSSDAYRLMETFALKHASDEASNNLLSALEKRKPFRRFKDALGEFPDDRRRWFEFEAEAMKRIAEEFYDDEGYVAHWMQSPAGPAGAD